MKKTIKILKYISFAILCFFSILILWLGFLYCYKKGENQIVIIPDNYQGAVIVLCGEKEGVPNKYNNGERVYEIPKNGILKTNFNFQNGKRYKIKYSFKSGKEIRYLAPSDIVWKDTTNPKSIYKDSIYAYNLSYADDFWFIIGKPKDISKHFNELNVMWKPFSKTITLKEGESFGKVVKNPSLNNSQ